MLVIYAFILDAMNFVNDWFTLVPEVNKRCKQIREQITSEIKLSQRDLLHLLLNISEFELNLKQLIEKVALKSDELVGEVIRSNLPSSCWPAAVG